MWIFDPFVESCPAGKPQKKDLPVLSFCPTSLCYGSGREPDAPPVRKSKTTILSYFTVIWERPLQASGDTHHFKRPLGISSLNGASRVCDSPVGYGARPSTWPLFPPRDVTNALTPPFDAAET